MSVRGVRALGVDPGSKRIGIAVSDLSGTIASPLLVLQRSRSSQHDLHEIARIARDEEADVIVVGLPLNMDGSEGPAAKRARTEAGRLATVVDHIKPHRGDDRLLGVVVDQHAHRSTRLVIADHRPKVAPAVVMSA